MRNLWLFVLPWCVFLSHPTSLFGALTNVIDLSPGADLPTVLSNVPNNSVIRIGAGIYPVVPSKVLSNGVGGINIFSKSNIVIEGVPGETILDGSSALGAILYVTNCSHFTLRGVTVVGLVVTNYTLVSAIGHVWSSLAVYGVDNFLVENCRFIDGHDHGIHDMGAQPNWNLISTNNIVIRSNYFDNFGSARTNETVIVDGTAVVPTGWLVENNEFFNCLRCVEPYSESDGTPNVFFNCIIRSNRMINTLDAAILTAGSTNAHNVLIEGNYIYNEPGYTRRGTNMAGEVAVFLNGGQGHVIRGNQIINPSYIGVFIGGGDRTMSDVVIEDNVISNADSQLQGFGIHTYSSAGPEIRNLTIRNNRITRARNYAIQLYSLRDSIVEGNSIVDPGVLFGPAIKLAVYASSFNTNVLIARNEIVDTTGVMSSGVEVEEGNKSVRVIDNCVSGGWAGPLFNAAGGETIFASRGSKCNADLIPVFINEWMVGGDEESENDDAEEESWFELYNAANYSVDLGGYFLTDDLTDKLKFVVPDDHRYLIPPGGFLVVRAGSVSSPRGFGRKDLRVEFTLAQGNGAIGIFAADGSQIDAVEFIAPSNNVAEARIPDGGQKRWLVPVSTPGESNIAAIAPRNVGIAFEQGVATLSFEAVPGFTYKVEYKDHLDDENWQPIGPGQEAGSENVHIVDETSANLERFYRVVGQAY